jgi:hypothetical protein|eukprot:SAG25_NODE_600_length_6634_cov_5.554093_2_plen_140_part_00
MSCGSVWPEDALVIISMAIYSYALHASEALRLRPACCLRLSGCPAVPAAGARTVCAVCAAPRRHRAPPETSHVAWQQQAPPDHSASWPAPAPAPGDEAEEYGAADADGAVIVVAQAAAAARGAAAVADVIDLAAVDDIG